MKRYFLFFLILFISINTFSYLYFDNIFKSKSQAYLKLKLNKLESNYQNSTLIIEDYAKLIFNNNILTDDVYQIIRYLPNASESEQAYIRNKLYSHILSLYKALKNGISMRQFHFHLPDGRSFLRMHRPEKYGDHLFNVRPSIKMVNTQLIYMKGFEEGRIFNGYRYVYPLIFNDEHFGSVEISVSINALFNHMKKLTDSNYCFMIKKLAVEEKLFPDEKSNYQEALLSQWYLHDKSVNHEYCTDTIAKFLAGIKSDQKNITRLENSRSFSTVINEDGKTSIANFLAIKNTIGNTVAYIFSIDDDTVYPQLKSNFISRLVFISIVTFSVLFFFYFLLYKNQFIKKQAAYLEDEVIQRTAQLNEALEKEKRYIQLLNVINAVNKKIYQNTKLESVFKYCINIFTTLPSCVFSIISVNLDGKYIFYSDSCEKFSSHEKTICEKVLKLMHYFNEQNNTELIVIDDLKTEKKLDRLLKVFKKYSIRKILVLPLIDESTSQHYGSLFFFSSRMESFEEHEQQLFKELSKSISFAITMEQNKNQPDYKGES